MRNPQKCLFKYCAKSMKALKVALYPLMSSAIVCSFLYCRYGFAPSIVRRILYHIPSLRRRRKCENRKCENRSPQAGGAGADRVAYVLLKNWKEA